MVMDPGLIGIFIILPILLLVTLVIAGMLAGFVLR